MNREVFKAACEKVYGCESSDRQRKGIGTLGEKTLHAVLKEYYEPDCDNQEVRLGSYVADIVGESGVIEIQTANFGRLIPKLDVFLDCCDVTVVYPMAAVKYLRWLDPESGELSERRRSPKRLTIYDAARELYVLRYALDNPRFHLKLCMLEIEEIRLLDGKRSKNNPKIGSSRCDRLPVDIIDEVSFYTADDYRKFVPDGLPDVFSCKQFAELAGTNTGFARRIINILVYLGIASLDRKVGNRYIYRINEKKENDK